MGVCVCVYVIIYQITYFKYVQFIVCQLYINKTIWGEDRLLVPKISRLEDRCS